MATLTLEQIKNRNKPEKAGGTLTLEQIKQRSTSGGTQTTPQPEEKKRSVLGRVANFIAPTATKAFGKAKEGESLTGRDVIGSALEIGSFFVPVGAIGRGLGLAGKGAVSLGRKAALGAGVGAVTGALSEAGRTIGQEGSTAGDIIKGTALGGIGGGAFGAALPVAGRGISKAFGGAQQKIAQETAQSTAEELSRKVLQPTAKQGSKVTEAGAKVLPKIDTKGVKTYDDLVKTVDNAITKNKKAVDREFTKSSARPKLKELADPQTKVNHVETALRDLEELYTKTRDPRNLQRIKQLQKKAIKDGISPTQINKLSREYNTKFGQKAFSKATGDPLTSVNAVAYENTRKGLKETGRSFLKTKRAQLLDEEISSMITVKKAAERMKQNVAGLEARIEKRNIIERAFRGLGNIVDIATFGGPKAFISKAFIPSNIGQKTMNSLDLEKQLAKTLGELNQLNNMSDESLIQVLQNFIIQNAQKVNKKTNVFRKKTSAGTRGAGITGARAFSSNKE